MLACPEKQYVSNYILICCYILVFPLLISGHSTLLLPPDYRSLSNPWINLPESASSFMTLFVCPDQRFKTLGGRLSPDSVSPALTRLLFPDYRTLLTHREYKPKYV
ncbi:hypothetical protein ILYODFUR_035851 [Ilyodon furcidens]|uniref:Secreted protein n=1 Tax=Ilyodon furcidens TaxID=33524 RepID=A0ABV0T2Z5_9TELE